VPPGRLSTIQGRGAGWRAVLIARRGGGDVSIDDFSRRPPPPPGAVNTAIQRPGAHDASYHTRVIIYYEHNVYYYVHNIATVLYYLMCGGTPKPGAV